MFGSHGGLRSKSSEKQVRLMLVESLVHMHVAAVLAHGNEAVETIAVAPDIVLRAENMIIHDHISPKISDKRSLTIASQRQHHAPFQARQT